MALITDAPIERLILICPCGCQSSSTMPVRGLLRSEQHPGGVLLVPAADTWLMRLALGWIRLLCTIRPPRALLVWIVYVGGACHRFDRPRRLCAYGPRPKGLLAFLPPG